MQKYISLIDGCEFDYEIVNGNLSFRIEGTDWQDFILEAFNTYVERFEKGDLEYVHYSWGDGDSLDRERVRDIILEEPQFSFGG